MDPFYQFHLMDVYHQFHITDVFHLPNEELISIRAKTLDCLLILAEDLEEREDDTAAETFIFTSLLISERSSGSQWVDRAYLRAKSWIDSIPDYDPKRRHRLGILSYIIAAEIEHCSLPSGCVPLFSDERLVEIIRLAGVIVSQRPDTESTFAGERRLAGIQVYSLLHRKLFEATRNMSILDHAIGFLQSVAADPQDPDPSALCFRELFSLFLDRYSQTHSSYDQTQAIDSAEMCMALCPILHGQASVSNTDGFVRELMKAYAKRYFALRSAHDLDQTIAICKIGVTLHLEELSLFLFHFLSAVLGLLDERKSPSPEIDDIEMALTACRQLIECFPESTELSSHYKQLAYWLWARSQMNGSSVDFSACMQAYQDAFDSYPDQKPLNGKIEIIATLWNSDETKVDHGDQLCKQANEMIKIIMASSNFGEQSEETKSSLDLLQLIILSYQLLKTGEEQYLKRGMDIAQRFHQGHKDYINIHIGLIAMLQQQYMKNGSMAYLNQAIEIGESIMERARATGIWTQVACSLSLGAVLLTRSARNEHWDGVDISRVIEMQSEALEVAEAAVKDTTSTSTPSQEQWIFHLHRNIGKAYYASAWRLSAAESFESYRKAIFHLEKTATRGKDDGIQHALGLIMLAKLHMDLAGLTDESSEHLLKAFKYSEMSIDLSSKADPFRCRILGRAGEICHHLYTTTRDKKYLTRALKWVQESWQLRRLDPSWGICSALNAGKLLTLLGRKSEASMSLKDAIDFLPQVSQRHLDTDDKQYLLSEIPGLASLSAALTLDLKGTAEEAIQLLERGRGVIGSLIMDMRTDVSELIARDSTLAGKFISIRKRLDSAAMGSTMNSALKPWELNEISRQHSDLSRQFDDILQDIRSLDGFERFMLPLAKAEMIEASSLGSIVVINVTPIRCDVILIDQRATETGRPPIRLLPLPDLKEEAIIERVQQMRQTGIDSATLEWLWDKVVCPVLDDLGVTERPENDAELPNIWWILTGPLSHLPVHAAGYHGTRQTALDRVISSYCPTIRSLWYGRQKINPTNAIAHQLGRLHSSLTSPASTQTSALFVAMAKTDELKDLEFAAKEVELLVAMCPDMKIQPVQPLATKKEVLENIANCQIFHFAGHGSANPINPSKSCLLLKDWKNDPLTVADLRDSNLRQASPFLGYLSACSTSVSQKDKLVDESVHLVNALQLAGFRHVIGTLWQVSDSHCVTVAKIVYETIKNNGLTDQAVRLGLHKAAVTLRDELMPEAESRRVKRLADDASADDAEDCMREERDGHLINSASDSLAIQLWAAYIHVGV